jgi:UDP-GlcNAc:undecaprenyl-phosphate GlcNAc-1-phosphate transferase
LPIVARVLLSLAYKRRLIEMGLDALLVAAGYFAACVLRTDFQISYPTADSLMHSLPIVVGATMMALIVTGVYRGIWRYTALTDALRFAEGAALSAILVFAASMIFPIRYDFAVAVIFALLLFNLLGLTRLSFHFFHTLVQTLATSRSRVLVVGGDSEAAEAARHLFLNPARRVTLLGFVDDDDLKLGKLIHGCEVLGCLADLDRIFDEHPFEELLIASASLSQARIIALCEFARRRSIVMHRFVQGVVAGIEGSEASNRDLLPDHPQPATA